ncbi:hypothetical protein BDN70DRAFT_375140 [Pholiota conissans]|uniref:F-box domain-containing protein n=1 Tax=Pholiota conissans TaxID=109636 RepID=A0A9P6CWJ3_9AGAR|nr:hypothetical protein BDN70DRAFT_375140 [Pholiota conissans]
MLVAFPEELLVRILSALHAASLTRCAMACKRIHNALRNSSLLQYIVELHFNGLIDAGEHLGRESNCPELTDKVQRRRHALMSPKWALNTVTDISLPDYSSSLAYDYVGNTFFRYTEESLEITTLSTNFATNVVKAHTVAMPLEHICFGGEPNWQKGGKQYYLRSPIANRSRCFNDSVQHRKLEDVWK